MDFGFDPQRALDQLKKFAADAPAQIVACTRNGHDEAAPPDDVYEVAEIHISLSASRRGILSPIASRRPRALAASGEKLSRAGAIRCYCEVGPAGETS